MTHNHDFTLGGYDSPHRCSLQSPGAVTFACRPPSETQMRRQKYQFFEKQCSEVAPGIYLSGDYVAKNR